MRAIFVVELATDGIGASSTFEFQITAQTATCLALSSLLSDDLLYLGKAGCSLARDHMRHREPLAGPIPG